MPNGLAISRPLAEVQVKTSGDRLVVTSASGSDDDLRLVFKSTLDWTPLGLKREVDARRRAVDTGPGTHDADSGAALVRADRAQVLAAVLSVLGLVLFVVVFVVLLGAGP